MTPEISRHRVLLPPILASDDYGDVTLKNIKSKEQLALNLSAGQLNADTLSGKTVTIYNDSGNISLDSCTSDDLHLETDYGDIQLDNAAVKNGSPMIVELFLWLK